MYPKAIQKLIEAFSRFPAIGPRTAARFVFYLMRASDAEIEELVRAIGAVKQKIKFCEFCFNAYEENGNGLKLCEICGDKTRDQNVLCVVEKESDLEALEKTKQYKGRYFILGGVQDILKKEAAQNMKVEELKQRVNSGVKEVILALNPTAEGETASLYVERALKPFGVTVTRIGRGIPVGGELEYADEETLRSALEGRR
ncbi:MAG TPA: recombination mediator RecR [Candidatus Paceibacterota bacterium]